MKRKKKKEKNIHGLISGVPQPALMFQGWSGLAGWSDKLRSRTDLDVAEHLNFAGGNLQKRNSAQSDHVRPAASRPTHSISGPQRKPTPSQPPKPVTATQTEEVHCPSAGPPDCAAASPCSRLPQRRDTSGCLLARKTVELDENSLVMGIWVITNMGNKQRNTRLIQRIQ